MPIKYDRNTLDGLYNSAFELMSSKDSNAQKNSQKVFKELFGVSDKKDLDRGMFSDTVSRFEHAFRTGEYHSASGRVHDFGELMNGIRDRKKTGESTDVVMSNQLTRFIETAVVNMIREPYNYESNIVPRLFQEINLPLGSQSINIHHIGSVHIFDVAEGENFKESDLSFNQQKERIDISISKVGAMVTVTEDVLEQKMFDYVRVWLNRAGRALSNYREKKSLQILERFGTTLMDAKAPSYSELGIPTGRGIDGVQNGTMTYDDFIGAYAWMVMRGIYPDTIVMNPMAWQVFMRDTELKEVIKGSMKMPSGNSAPGWSTSFNGLGNRSNSTGNPGMSTAVSKLGVGTNSGNELAMFGASYNIPPSDQFPTGMVVIVSPFMNFKEVTIGAAGTAKGYTTDILLVDSKNCGVVVNRQAPSVKQFDDPWRDLTAIKISEKYGFGIMEGGNGIGILKNIVIDRNYNFANNNNVSLAVLDNEKNLTIADA